MSNDEKIHGDVLQKALNAFDFLGIALKDALIEYIEKNGFILDEDHSYTLNELQDKLAAVFGYDAAELMIKRLGKALQEQSK